MEKNKTIKALVIIIVIVLGIVVLSSYPLNHGPGEAIISPSCIAATGYFCGQAPPIFTQDGLSFSIGSSISEYNVKIACLASSNTNYIKFYNLSNINKTLIPDQITSIKNLTCYNTNGSVVTGLGKGTFFAATIIVNYTSANSHLSANTTYHTVKAFTLIANVT